MRKEATEYIPRIKELGLNDIYIEQQKHIMEVFGPDFLNPASDYQKNKAREYLNGPKQDFEAVFASIVWHSFGKVLSRYAAGQIQKLDPTGNGYYSLDVGFNGSSIEMIKIQTYKPNTDQVENGLFEGASFSDEDSYTKSRILDGKLPKILRAGLDEITQLEAVSKREMFSIGPRGHTKNERRSNEVLYQLINNGELNNSEIVKWVLQEHQHLVKNGIKPGIANPRSCLYGPLTSHMVRMALDVCYLEKASRELDLKILYLSLMRRTKRVARVVKHIGTKKE